jgi:hypothetical protein
MWTFLVGTFIFVCPSAAQPGGVVRCSGKVVDPNGRPVQGASITLSSIIGRQTVLSGEGGTFEVPWSPGPAPCIVCRYEARNLAFAQEIAPATQSIDIRLTPGLTFTGKVVDPNGKGIGGAKIEVKILLGKYAASLGTGGGQKTDSQGQFEIKTIPADLRYRVQASADGYGVKDVAAGADGSEDDRLDVGTLRLAVANMSAAGIVVDVNDKPVANAHVSVNGLDQPFRSTDTDASGRFHVQKICPGSIEISASCTGPSRAYGGATVQAGDAGVKVVVRERSSSGALVDGQIPSLKGKPLPELKGLGLTAAGTDGKSVLVCMVDVGQRPSRKCLSDLAKKAETLAARGVSVAVVQVSQADLKQQKEWIKESGITFPMHVVDGDFEAKKTSWGVKALPWLILTDKEHRVVAEGFDVGSVGTMLGAPPSK